MRIAVDNLFAGKQSAAFFHVLQNHRVGFFSLHTGVLSGILGVAAPVVHRHHHLHAIAAAGLVVVGAKAGGGMNAACAAVHSDILGQQKPGGFIQERMLRQHIFKESAGMFFQNFIGVKAAGLHYLFRQRLGHDIVLAVFRFD